MQREPLASSQNMSSFREELKTSITFTFLLIQRTENFLLFFSNYRYSTLAQLVANEDAISTIAKGRLEIETKSPTRRGVTKRQVS